MGTLKEQTKAPAREKSWTPDTSDDGATLSDAEWEATKREAFEIQAEEVAAELAVAGNQLLALRQRYDSAFASGHVTNQPIGAALQRLDDIVRSYDFLPGSPEREKMEAARATRCSCEWSDKPWHDEFLAIESSGPYWAVDLIGYMVDGIDNDQVYDMAPNDFESFVSQHNWQDPRQMTWLAIHLQYIFQNGR